MGIDDQLRVMEVHDKSYDIRRTSGQSFQYRVTVPSEIVETVGFAPSERVRFVPFLRGNTLNFVYAPFSEYETSHMALSFTQTDYSGIVRVPSAFGAALNVDDGSVEWSAVEINEETVGLYGQTDLEVPPVAREFSDTEDAAFDGAALLATDVIDNQQQSDVRHEDESWNQEQFRYYISDDMAGSLGWTEKQQVGIGVSRIEDTLVMIADATTADAAPEPLQKRVGPTRDESRAGLLYFPNDIVRSLRFAGSYADEETSNQLSWNAHQQSLVVCPELRDN